MRFSPLFLLFVFLFISSSCALESRRISGVWNSKTANSGSQLSLVLMPNQRMGIEFRNEFHYPGTQASCKVQAVGDFESSGPDSGLLRASLPTADGGARLVVSFDASSVALSCDNCGQFCDGNARVADAFRRSQMASIPPATVRDIVARISAASAAASPAAQSFAGDFSGLTTYNGAVKLSIVPSNVAWAKVTLTGVSADQTARCQLQGDATIDDKSGTMVVLGPKRGADECRIIITRMSGNKLLLQDPNSNCASMVCKGDLNFNDRWAKFKSIFVGTLNRNTGAMGSEAEFDSAELESAEVDSSDSASIDTSANRMKRSVSVTVDIQ